MAKPCLTRKCIVCGVISCANFQIALGYFSATWLLKQLEANKFSEQGKLLLAELGRDFLEVESKCYISEQENDGEKEQRPALVKILTYLTPGIRLIVSSATSVSFKDSGRG